MATSRTSSSCSRELIRKKLAAAHAGCADQPSDLLVCFLNEEASDQEHVSADEDDDEDEDDEEEGARVRNLVAVAQPQQQQQQPEGRRVSRSLKGHHNPYCLERLSARNLVKNNISKKKEHIIIPLRCSAADDSEEDPDPEGNGDSVLIAVTSEVRSGTTKEEDDELDCVQRAFFKQLEAIQLEARGRLHDAKRMAVKTIQAERKSLHVNSEINRVFGVSKLSRRFLTGMNLGQLQFLLNYLLSQIEALNEQLVQGLLTRDELVNEQDALLTDIQDITKCIGQQL